jgi:hypothetical protein
MLSDYWILLDNGKYMQPCELGVNLSGFQPYDGMRVKFGYTKPANTSGCDARIRCLAETPPAEIIKLTCIQEMPNSQCSYHGTVVYNPLLSKPCNPKVIRLDNGRLIEPVNQDILTGYNDGDRVTCGYVTVQTFAATCSGAAAVELTCFNGQVPSAPCKPLTVGDDPMFSTEHSAVQISQVWIEGDCLKIKGGFSGCNDDISDFILYHDGMISKSNPSQVKLVVANAHPTLCEAYFTKTFSFDLSALKQSAGQLVNINLVGWNQVIQY